MAYEQRDGSGNLFRNDKGDNPKRPDYRGEIMLGGVLYELSSWIKEGKNGKFMSLSGKPKEQRSAPREAPRVQDNPTTDFDDPIPF